MEVASKEYVINTVYRTNILPLISQCNTSCIFCSHKQNPEGIEVFRLPQLDMNDFKEILDYISPNKKLIIGESATRIIEGEPLLHRNFEDILMLIRSRYRSLPIQVTTNGILLDEALINKMVELGNIELNISVNCTEPTKRKRILGLKKDHDIGPAIKMLKGRLRFSGSCVIVPGIMDWHDVEDIISLLDYGGAESVRIFLPGYTFKAEDSVDLFSMYGETCVFIEKMRKRYSVPVTVEPPLLKDLRCTVEGVVKGSAADNAGIRTGDIITHIDGEAVITRVDGYNRAFRAANPVLAISRGDESFDLKLTKGRSMSSGFIVLYDIDPYVADQIAQTAENHKAHKVLIITSELACNILVNLLDLSGFEFEYEVVSVPNTFFGGTIKCAGLLTVQDVLRAADEYIKRNGKPDLILLPPAMLDFKRRDLLGRSIKEIEEKLRVVVDTVS